MNIRDAARPALAGARIDLGATMARKPLTISAPGVRVRRGLRWVEQHARVAFDDVRDKRGKMHGASRSDVSEALAWIATARKGETR
jgi:hypothetical protein